MGLNERAESEIYLILEDETLSNEEKQKEIREIEKEAQEEEDDI